MPNVLQKQKKRANKIGKTTVNNSAKTSPIKVASADAATTVVTVTFDQVVFLKGVPQYTTDVAGADPISAVMTGPTTIAITYSATVAAATALNIPYEEPAVRNSSGGFVSTSTFPV
jgi:hypothetical protein